MITYNWNFDPLTVGTTLDGFENVVLTVHWQYTAISGSYSARTIGTQDFSFNPNQENFIPFDQLTKEIVEGWVVQAMGENRIHEMQESLASQIEEQISPKVVNMSPPWNMVNLLNIP
jgi:hypothetical protein